VADRCPRQNSVIPPVRLPLCLPFLPPRLRLSLPLRSVGSSVGTRSRRKPGGPSPPTEAPGFTFAQPWLTQTEVGFQPDEVKIAALSHDLLVWADLKAPSREHTATRDHTRLWEQGDVFEIFLQAVGEPGYFEYHLAPNGHILQLAFPQRWDRSGDITPFINPQPRLRSRISLDPSGWRVFAVVPLPEGNTFSTPRHGRWRVSFGRYHYRSDGHAVISGTSPHPVPDFHRPAEWSEFTLSST